MKNGLVPPSTGKASIRKRQRDGEPSKGDEHAAHRHHHEHAAAAAAAAPPPEAAIGKATTTAAATPQQPPLFLPTHLALLRALHADNQTTGANVADSCPHPSWLEVNSFVQLQASIAQRLQQAKRTRAVLLALGGPTAAAAPASAPAAQPHKRPRVQRSASMNQDPTRADQAGGIVDSSGGPPTRSSTLPLQLLGRGQQTALLGSSVTGTRRPAAPDPRSIVCAVLRRAVRDREEKHKSVRVRLRRLTVGVDETVGHLASSLERLARSRRNREMTWRMREEEGAHAADVFERHANKLLLWRKLQTALSACRMANGREGEGAA